MVISLWLILCVAIVFGATVGILVTSWRSNIHNLWFKISTEQTENVALVIDSHLNIVDFASRFVPFNGPESILDYYVSYDRHSGYHFSSMGTLTRATNTTNGKYSWQIARYEAACPIYGYFYSDQTIYDDFYGYCCNTTTIDYSNITYRGKDWGLKPEEAQLVDGIIEETYLPIFNLLGNPTLTHEWRRENGYVSFAELDLETLSEFLKQNITTGVVLIVDNNLGEVIASSSEIIKSPYQIQNDNWSILSLSIKRTGLSWTIYAGVENIYQDVNYRLGVACGIALVIMVIISVFTILWTYCWITKPIQRLKNQADYAFTPISDF